MPYGYKRVPIGKEKTEIVIDEFQSQIVKRLTSGTQLVVIQ